MIKRMINIITIFIVLLINPGWVRNQELKISWQKEYKDAFKLAKELGKPVMMDFWANWCQPCKAMDRNVWTDPKVAAYAQKFIPAKVNIDYEKGISEKYRINNIPTIVFTDPLGNEITRSVGYTEPYMLIPLMISCPENYSEITYWAAILEKDSKNLDALYRVAEFYGKMGTLELSNRYYKRALKSNGAKKNPRFKESIMENIGLNFLKMKKYIKAQKTFERCLKKFPNGTRSAFIMLELLTTQLSQGKTADAKITFEKLQSNYPDSPATQQAARNLQAHKN